MGMDRRGMMCRSWGEEGKGLLGSELGSSGVLSPITCPFCGKFAGVVTSTNTKVFPPRSKKMCSLYQNRTSMKGYVILCYPSESSLLESLQNLMTVCHVQVKKPTQAANMRAQVYQTQLQLTFNTKLYLSIWSIIIDNARNYYKTIDKILYYHSSLKGLFHMTERHW